jgi:uncharacterized phage protein (TIGR01671 family)
MGDKMREIKFRGWDTKHNGWIDDIAEKIGDKKVDDMYDHEEWWMICAYRYGFCDYHKPGRFTWEQFTGIVDKNGKEIYEGDIVKDQTGEYSNNGISTPIYSIGEVFWAGPFCGYYRRNSEHEWVNSFGKGAEVIGNIHENKELIK